MTYKEIKEKIFWVGSRDHSANIHCNPYLLVDGDEAVLFDPGSVLDYDTVLENIKSIIPLSKINYIVLHHQDPDICSSVPLLEKAGVDAKIVTFWRTAVLIKYYGINSDIYQVNDNNYELILKSGRKLDFLLTPYMHFPGAMMTYDTKSKVLFSSDIFGAFSQNWDLYAGENYIEAMKVFHENYMPSNDIVRPVMESLRKYDISMIAPQHGSIIKSKIKKHIDVLANLECGAFLNPIKKDIAESGGYLSICNTVLKRYYAVYSREEVVDVFEDTSIILDKDSGYIKDFNCTGKELWDMIFDVIYSKKGMGWISAVDTLVTKLTNEYGIDMPAVFKNKMFSFEKKQNEMSRKNLQLKKRAERLKKNLDNTKQSLLKDDITGLHNKNFFRNFMLEELKELKDKDDKSGAVLFIKVDNLSRIAYRYGTSDEEDVLRTIAYLLDENKEDYHNLFKLGGGLFSLYTPEKNLDHAVKIADKIKNKISESSAMIEPITTSIGVAGIEEFYNEGSTPEKILSSMTNTLRIRVEKASKAGDNTVIFESDKDETKGERGTILIVDNDQHNVDMLQSVLEKADYLVLTCADGDCALEMAEKNHPDIIVSELILPKLDGISLWKSIKGNSILNDIRFIFTSYKKDEDMIKTVYEAGIKHYFKKPYLLPEITGLISSLIKDKR